MSSSGRPIPSLELRLTRFWLPGEGGRLRIVSLRVVRGADGFVLSAVGGEEGAAYVRLSKEAWRTLGDAEKALREGLWTPKSDRVRRLRH